MELEPDKVAQNKLAECEILGLEEIDLGRGR